MPPGTRTDAGLAVGWEEHAWKPGEPAAGLTRAERLSVGKRYQAAVPARIANMHIEIEPEVAAEADDARGELSRFDEQIARRFPGEFMPLQAVLLRTESASSSQIENITAGAKALALAEIGLASHGSNAELVAANVDAMTQALALADDVRPETILAVHEALMRGQDYADPGRFRDQQVWIGGTGYSPHSATFVPPHETLVPAAIDDLCAFVERVDLPLLTQAAIAHAQFETIHPFNDGNGRTGRALVHALLKRGGATTRATVPVSAGLLNDTDSYFRALTAYRAGDPNPIVRQFAGAAMAAIRNGTRLAEDLAEIHARWSESLTVRSDAVAWRVLTYLLSQPSVTSKLVQQKMSVAQPTADNALGQLREAGILAEPRNVQGRVGQRNLVWHATDVLDALDDFGRRARRG